MGDKKRGRPKGPCSAKELEQRRSAAIKHSKHVKDPLKQAAGPCKESHCPHEKDGDPETAYPCTARRAADSAEEGLACCLVNLATRDDLHEVIAQSLQTGNLEDFEQNVIAPGLATMARMHRVEGERILSQGSLAAEQRLVSRDGADLGTVPVKDPGVDAYLQISRMLGMTADQQGLTRASKAKAGRDKAIGNFFDWSAQMQAREDSLEGDS